MAASSADPLLRRARWHAAEFAFWAACFACVFIFPSRALLINEIAILGLFAVSLDLLLGYSGIVSLGHTAFFGLGAYAAGLLGRYGWGDPLLGLAAAAALAAALGFVTGFLVLRGSDLTRLMVTLGIASMLYELANKTAWLTGGADGMQGIVVKPLLGLFEFDFYGRTAALYSLTALFALFCAARRLVNSPFGLSLMALRDNPLRAASLGIPVNRRLIAVHTLAAAYAGVAGALLTQTTAFASLDGLDFHRSADVLLVLTLGGIGYLYGGLIGAAFFKIMQDWLAALTPQYWEFWIGVMLMVFVLAGRERLRAWPRRVFAALAARASGKADAPA